MSKVTGWRKEMGCDVQALAKVSIVGGPGTLGALSDMVLWKWVQLKSSEGDNQPSEDEFAAMQEWGGRP